MRLRSTVDRHLRARWLRPFRNAGILALGRGAQSVLSLLTIVLVTRVLGPEQFGVLILVHGLIVLTTQILRFQSWQAVLKYGAPALHINDVPGFHRVVFHAFGLDLSSAVLAFAILLVCSDTISSFAGIPETQVELTRLYAISVVFLILDACPTGILRLLDRHDLISWQSTVEPLIRCAGTLVLFVAGGTLEQFLLIWLMANVASKLVLFAFAHHALIARGLALDWQNLDSRCMSPVPGIWRFTLGTNIGSSLNVGDVQIGPLLAGGLLGASEAGLYRIAQQVSNAVAKPVSKLLVPAIYTDLSELAASGDHAARRIVVERSGLLAGIVATVVCAVIVFFGETLIGLLFGAAFIPAYAAVVWFAVAGVLTTFTFPLVPQLISSGHVRAVVQLRGLALSVYLACFYMLVPSFALTGAGITVMVHAVVTVGLSLLFTRLLIGR